MGVSTDAILFYGIDLGEESMQWHEEDQDWEECYAARLGVLKPDLPFEENKEVYSQYWDKKRDLVKASGCKVGWYCSGEYPMRYVAIDATEIRVWRGDCAEIKDLDIPLNANARIKRFCEIMGIEYEEPKWLLVSYWG